MRSRFERKPGHRLRRVSWYLYDLGIAAVAVTAMIYIFPPYFTKAIAPNKILGTALWGYTIAVASFILAIISPMLGAIADYNGRRKGWLFISSYVLIIAVACLWFSYPTPASVVRSLLFVVIINVGYEICFIFCNAFLPVAADHVSSTVGRVSGWGYGFGSIGALSMLGLSLFIILTKPSWLDLATAGPIRMTMVMSAIWFIVFSLPFFLFFKDEPNYQYPIREATRLGLQELKQTLLMLPREPNLFYYLIARMIYADGMITLIAFGGIYAAGTFNFTPADLLLLGLLLNVGGGIGSVVGGVITDLLGAKSTILLTLLVTFIELIIVVVTHNAIVFWVVAGCFGFSWGALLGASRTMMVYLSPPDKMAEMFGLYAVSGRATSFFGPLLFGWATGFFDTQRAGMVVIALFFIVGGLLMLRVKEKA